MGSIFQGRELRGVHEGPAAYECMSILRNAVTSLAERLLGGLILALVSVFVLFVLPIHCLRPSSSLFFLLLVTQIRGHMYGRLSFPLPTTVSYLQLLSREDEHKGRGHSNLCF